MIGNGHQIIIKNSLEISQKKTTKKFVSSRWTSLLLCMRNDENCICSWELHAWERIVTLKREKIEDQDEGYFLFPSLLYFFFKV